MKKILFIVVVVFSYVTIFGILSRLNIFNNKSDSLSSMPVLTEKTVTENGEYLSEDDNADGYSKVMVNIDRLNIAYGFTAPEDTSKLWIKTAAPEKINIVGGWEGDSYGLSSEKLSTQFSTARADMAFATVGSKVYLFGGSTSNGYLDNIVAFDMTTRTLADKTTKLPEKYVYSTAAAVGSNIYIFGGYVSATSPYTRNTIFRYDTITDTLTLLNTTLPVAERKMGCGVVGTKIYIFGGETATSPYTSDAIYVFDTETETISTLNVTLPDFRFDMGFATVGAKIYLFGGKKGSNAAYSTDIIIFDTVSNTVTTSLTALPRVLGVPVCGAYGTDIFIFGGYTYPYVKGNIYKFDTTTEIIAEVGIVPDELTEAAIGYSNENFYIMGGKRYNGSTWGTYNSSFQYICAITEVPENELLLTIGNSTNCVKLINSNECEMNIGVRSVLLGNSNSIGIPIAKAIYNGSEWIEI